MRRHSWLFSSQWLGDIRARILFCWFTCLWCTRTRPLNTDIAGGPFLGENPEADRKLLSWG